MLLESETQCYVIDSRMRGKDRHKKNQKVWVQYSGLLQKYSLVIHTPKRVIVCIYPSLYARFLWLFTYNYVGYAFGVVLWEMFHRRDPYPNMDIVTVAMEVMKKGIRPQIGSSTPVEIQGTFLLLCTFLS